MKTTPGPWHTGSTFDEARSIYAAEGRMRLENGRTVLYPIAWTVDFEGEAEANARLIAAAPELFALLKTIEAWWAEGAHDGLAQPLSPFALITDSDNAIWTDLQDAIAKAEGRTDETGD